MELNKCVRCGAFYVSNNSVCPKCETKENAELFKLKNFLSENECPNSIENLACSTGISVKNINRFLKNDDFSEVVSKLETGKIKDINIRL